MMLLNNINNNVLFSNPYYPGAYQDDSEKWDLFQEINIVVGWNQTKQIAETTVHVTNEITNM